MAGGIGLQNYPKLTEVTKGFDEYLQTAHPAFFGDGAVHPVLELKRHKVVHDNLWGTNKFTWLEWLLIDSPIMQRLKDIHQVGLAFEVYPCAHHQRFEHSLGVLTLASRTFDACVAHNAPDLLTFLPKLYAGATSDDCIKRLRQELRLAALLHDTGHSLFSHASEKVYSRLQLLVDASAELTRIAGKEKGAGEVISFCLAQTTSVRGLVARGRAKLNGTASVDEYDGEIDFDHVSLLIVGRAWHPYLQFLGDIISSAFDADKLDYLLRDATGAGLPLRYDLDRYLHAVHVNRSVLVDGEEQLKTLYDSVAPGTADRLSASGKHPFDYYESYRLRLPKSALNAIEQIVICKMMLFSYLYHHTKVRATEGLFERMLARAQEIWSQKDGLTDLQILCRYLDLTDAHLRSDHFLGSQDSVVREYSYRLVNRLVPREVMRINASIASHADRAPITDLLADLQSRAKRDDYIARIETEMGQALVKRNKALFGEMAAEALEKAGAWLDVPKAPKFADIDEVASGAEDENLELKHIFPVDKWTQAYTSYSYNVRIFAFSEYVNDVRHAARVALEKVTGVKSPDFYKRVSRSR